MIPPAKLANAWKGGPRIVTKLIDFTTQLGWLSAHIAPHSVFKGGLQFFQHTN